jgi:hypothetical protein
MEQAVPQRDLAPDRGQSRGRGTMALRLVGD